MFPKVLDKIYIWWDNAWKTQNIETTIIIAYIWRRKKFMKLKKQFEKFHNDIKIDRDQEAATLTEKRKILQSELEDKLPGILDKHDIKVTKSDLDIFDQGSYKLNTTIVVTPYDRDVAIIIPLDKNIHKDTRAIKKYVREALKHNNRTIDIKEPCVTVKYFEDGEEVMHIDLPVYALHEGKVYLARGSEFATEGNYFWEEADPKGLNDSMLNCIAGQGQMRRIIRYLKKWKYEKYKNTADDKKNQIPPSIGLTLLAFDCFEKVATSEGEDDLTALMKTMQNIVNQFDVTYGANGEITKAEITKYLPVKPWTDVFFKMKKSDEYGKTFYNRLSKALQNLIDACNESSEHDAGLSVQKVFGEEFEVPPKETSCSSISTKKEYSFG